MAGPGILSTFSVDSEQMSRFPPPHYPRTLAVTGGAILFCMRRVSLLLLALVVASALAVLPAAAGTTTAASHHKLFVAVKQNMPAAAESKLVVAVNVNQNGGPWASSEATAIKPAVFIQNNSRRYLVKVFLESTCKGVCQTKGYGISGAARHKLMVIPTCQYASKVFTCSKIQVVKVY
jgi:hypothetical protein